MFVEIMATIALLVGGLGAVVEVLARRGVTLPAALDPPNESLVTRLGRRGPDRPLLVVVAVGVAVVLFVFPFVDATMRAAGTAPPFGYWDFGAYTSALHRWLHGESLYVTNEQGGYFGTYLYPPFFVLVIWPFYELFDWGTAAMLWQVASVLFLWVSLQPVVAALGHRLRLVERGVLLWLLVGFHPVLFSVKQGQISAFLGGLIALSLYGLLRGERPDGRPARLASGACTAVVGTTKLVYGAVGTHLLVDRDRFAGAVVTAVAVVALSVAVFGVDAHLGYYDVLKWGKGGDPSPPWLWMRTYYHPFYALTPVALPVRLLLSAVLATLAFAARDGGVHREVFAMGVGAIPLVAPTAYNYYLTALLPAIVVLLAAELDRDGRPLLPVVALLGLQFHSYGLKVAVDRTVKYLPHPHAPVPVLYGDASAVVASLFQPGVWAAFLVVGLAGLRVTQAATARRHGVTHAATTRSWLRARLTAARSWLARRRGVPRRSVLTVTVDGDAIPTRDGAIDSTLRLESHADLGRVLGPRNLELLEAIAAHDPESVRATADLVDRDPEQVRQDLADLEELGIVEFAGPDGQSGAPRTVYDAVEIAVPLGGADPPADDG